MTEWMASPEASTQQRMMLSVAQCIASAWPSGKPHKSRDRMYGFAIQNQDTLSSAEAPTFAGFALVAQGGAFLIAHRWSLWCPWRDSFLDTGHKRAVRPHVSLRSSAIG